MVLLEEWGLMGASLLATPEPQLGSKSLTSLSLSQSHSLPLPQQQSVASASTSRRLPAQPFVADHPLKLLQPPNRTRSKRKKENGQLFSSVSNNQEHVCSSRHCCEGSWNCGIRTYEDKVGRELLYKKRIRTESLKTWLQSRQALIRIWISFCTRCLTKVS
ncbi:hypothetical protein GQ457_12G016200 [Hibiscus cannabinus]